MTVHLVLQHVRCNFLSPVTNTAGKCDTHPFAEAEWLHGRSTEAPDRKLIWQNVWLLAPLRKKEVCQTVNIDWNWGKMAIVIKIASQVIHSYFSEASGAWVALPFLVCQWGSVTSDQFSTFSLYEGIQAQCWPIGCPKKTKSLNFGTQLTPVVFIGYMSHQKKFQHYRSINDILAPISSFTL